MRRPGGEIGANRRRLAKYIHPGRAQTAQLLMGVTTLATGNVWNTMPSHRHVRRTEVHCTSTCRRMTW